MTSARGELPRRIRALGMVGLVAPGRSGHVAAWRASDASPFRVSDAGSEAVKSRSSKVNLGGVAVDLMDRDAAVAAIMERAVAGGPRPLGVLSANLDHLNHFGVGGRWENTLDTGDADWLTLLDGAPLVGKSEELTGRQWPRLAGSDLIEQILGSAADRGLAVGFLGGSEEAQRAVAARLEAERPHLTVAGWWAPDRELLTDPSASRQLCSDIRAAGADILLVCLGKPRQELWIAEYAHLTGAKVLLAFGAVIDFLAGNVRRAPAQVSKMGLEWAWRLAIEPRRLAKRYLVEGPESYVRLCRHSAGLVPGAPPTSAAERGPLPAHDTRAEGFTPVSEHAEIAALVVTYNNGADVCGMLESLLQETKDQSIKVVVADNSPTPETLLCLQQYPEVLAFATGGNRGYAGGINAARAKAGSADAFLVLNPDLRFQRGAVRALRSSMARTGAGVVVPLLRDEDGTLYPSLRREPSILRALGDATLGSKLPGRPGWLSEMDFDAESYAHPHKVEWATGAALLIRADVAERVGGWDESYFLYSEETDYLHRVRELKAAIWFEPLSVMMHCRGGSGSSPALDALMAANRIRYARKFHSGSYARAFRAAVVLSALLRAPLAGHKGILGLVSRESRWPDLPHAVAYPTSPGIDGDFPSGAVIIPAHNEASVLGRTLSALQAPLATGQVEIVVACNGCSDGTETVAGSVPGVRVLKVAEASKVAALNAADEAAELWPRVYVDADIEVPPEALRATLEALRADDGVRCARPAFVYDTSGASWPVRAYYRARNRLPQSSRSIWGAGVYGLNKEGHKRLGRFPSLTADDCYIDRFFKDSEKAIVECTPVTVRTPRSARLLLSTLRRVYRGNGEVQWMEGAHTGRTIRELAASIKGPASAADALVYAAFAAAGRLAPGRGAGSAWERDESSRR